MRVLSLIYRESALTAAAHASTAGVASERGISQVNPVGSYSLSSATSFDESRVDDGDLDGLLRLTAGTGQVIGSQHGLQVARCLLHSKQLCRCQQEKQTNLC
jgi:hypothetical protein